jgi:hypothetical protein
MCAAAFFLSVAEIGVGQVVFSQVAASRGIGPYWMAPGPVGGVAAEDYDQDGDIDLFVPNGEGVANQLYRNLGNGTFVDVAGEVGLNSLENHRAALWIDYDGDHLLDLVVGGDCKVDTGLDTSPCENPANIRLYRQQADGQFVDVTIAAGLDVAWGGTADVHRSGFAAGDLNNDGYLDLFMCGWPERAYLFMNDGEGAFTHHSNFAPIPRYYHQAAMFDVNDDGWLDIYATLDGLVSNRLWVNQGNGTFLEQAATAGVDHAHTDMGIALGDYDNDGDFDLFVTNITYPFGEPNNVFYRNDSVGSTLSFAEISASLGVGDTDWGWGTTFLDADNDGHQDLAVTNGRYTIGSDFEFDQSRFFRNNADSPATMTDVSEEVGFDDTYVAVCLIAADLDRDGDLDLVQTCAAGDPLRLLDNALKGPAALNHYLVIRPRMALTNHWAIGAVVTATVGTTTQMRLLTAGISQHGQEPAEAFFGLGAATSVDTVAIRWPNGAETTLSEVWADQVLTVYPCPADADGDGAVDLADVDAFARCLLGQTVPGDICLLADLTGNGITDGGDIAAFLNLITGGVACPPMGKVIPRGQREPSGAIANQ